MFVIKEDFLNHFIINFRALVKFKVWCIFLRYNCLRSGEKRKNWTWKDMFFTLFLIFKSCSCQTCLKRNGKWFFREIYSPEQGMVKFKDELTINFYLSPENVLDGSGDTWIIWVWYRSRGRRGWGRRRYILHLSQPYTSLTNQLNIFLLK